MTYCAPICERCGLPLPRIQDVPRCQRCHPQESAPGSAENEPPAARAAIPGHQLCESVGVGGMGEVIRARQENLERDVAVKVMIRANPEDPQRFLREAKVLAQLDHPNIVPIHDFGFDDLGRSFYTMKMVRGRTLKAILTAVRTGGEKRTLESLLAIFRKVCDAVAFAHSRMVVHRDLKPDNIMVGEFGEVMVMDWGLAGEIKRHPHPVERPSQATRPIGIRKRSAIGSDVEITIDGEVLGTPQYMSPEQASASCDLDERCDIYALGGILYTILTLRPPVRRTETMEMLENVREGRIEPFVRPKPFQPEEGAPWRVRPAMAAVVKKAMALRREDRFKSATEFAEDVDAHLEGYATTAEDISLLGEIWLLIKRHRTVSVAMLVLMLVSGAFVMQLMESEQRAMTSAQSARVSAEGARRAEQTARSSEATTRAALARSNLVLADSAYTATETGQMREALDAVPEDLRDTHWKYLNSRTDERLALPEWEGDSFMIGSAAHPARPGVFAAATQGATHRLLEFEARTGKILRSFPFRQGWARAVAYSPDASLIAIGRIQGDGISIHSATDGIELIHWPSGWVDQLEFLPDGKRLLQSDHAGCILWDVSTGKEIWRSGDGMTHFLSPSKEHVVAVGKDSAFLISVHDGSRIVESPIKPAFPVSSALAPNGDLLVIGHQDGQIRGYSVSRRSLIFESPAGDHGHVRAMAFTPEGNRFVSVSTARNGALSVELRDGSTGRALRRLRGGSGNIESLTIQAISQEILVAGARTATWALPLLPEPSWQFDGDQSVGGFLGGDDNFLGLAKSGGIEAFKLAGQAKIWAPSTPAAYRSAVSVDGRTAIMQLSGRPQPAHFQIVRADGEKITELSVAQFNADAEVLAINSDGTRAAMSGAWGTVRIRNMSDGAALVRPEDKDILATYDLTWHGTNPNILLGIFNTGARRGMLNSKECIVSWDTTTGKRIAEVQSDSELNCIAAEPGGNRIADGGNAKVVCIRDADTLKVRYEFRAHDAPLTAIAWHPGKPIIATGSLDRSVRLWDANTGQLLKEVYLGLREAEALHFSPSGKRLACVIASGKTLIWDLEER